MKILHVLLKTHVLEFQYFQFKNQQLELELQLIGLRLGFVAMEQTVIQVKTLNLLMRLKSQKSSTNNLNEFIHFQYLTICVPV